MRQEERSYLNRSLFPEKGEDFIIYIDIQNDLKYRWSLDRYVLVSTPSIQKPTIIVGVSDHINKSEIQTQFNDTNKKIDDFIDLFNQYFSLGDNVQVLKGLWTNYYLSSGGKNPNTEGSGGGFTEFIIKLGDVEINPEGYTSVDGVVTLPNYPSLDGYLLKDTADNLYQAKGDYTTREELNSLDKYIKSLFTAEYDENNALISIKANAGLWTN